MKITPTNVALALFALLACVAALVSYMSGPGSQDGQNAAPMEQAGSASGDQGSQQSANAAQDATEVGGPSSVAVVDMNRVLLESEAGAEAMRILSAMNERYLSEVNVLRQELAEDETEANYERLKETAARLQETVVAEQERYSSLLMEYAERLLADIREQGGWDLILDAAQVRSHSLAIDVTDDLIAAMNAEGIDLAADAASPMGGDVQAVGNATQVEGWDEHVAAEEAAAAEAAADVADEAVEPGAESNATDEAVEPAAETNATDAAVDAPATDAAVDAPADDAAVDAPADDAAVDAPADDAAVDAPADEAAAPAAGDADPAQDATSP